MVNCWLHCMSAGMLMLLHKTHAAFKRRGLPMLPQITCFLVMHPSEYQLAEMHASEQLDLC